MALKRTVVILAGSIAVFMAGVMILLYSMDYATQVKKLSEMVYGQIGRKLNIKGDVTVGWGLSPTLMVEDISLENAKWGTRPDMAKIKRLEIQLELLPLLKGNIVFKRLLLMDPRVWIEESGSGQYNFEFTPLENRSLAGDQDGGEEKGFMDALVFKQLVFQNSQVIYNDIGTGASRTVDIKILEVKTKTIGSPVHLHLAGNTRDIKFELNASLRSIASLLFTEKEYPFDLQLSSSGSDMSITGKFIPGTNLTKPGLKIDIHSKQINLATGDPQNNRGPGPLTRKTETKPISSQSKKPQSTPRDRPVDRTKVFPDEVLDLKFFTLIDLDARIHLEKILMDSLEITGIESRVSMGNETFEVSAFKAACLGGNITGSAVLKQSKNSLSVDTKLNIQKLRSDLLLGTPDKESRVQGLVDLSLSAHGRGKSVAQIMSTLDGYFWVAGEKGKIPKDFLKAIGGDLISKILDLINPVDILTSLASETGEEYLDEMNCLAARLDVKKGMGEVTVLIVDTPIMTASGKGKINFRDESFEISVKPTTKQGVGIEKLVTLNLSFGKLAESFRVGGSFVDARLFVSKKAFRKNLTLTTGGVVLFGPLGVLTTMVGANIGDTDVCPCALMIAVEGDNKNCQNAMTQKAE